MSLNPEIVECHNHPKKKEMRRSVLMRLQEFENACIDYYYLWGGLSPGL